MEFLHGLLLAVHISGAALIVGTFFVQMRASQDFRFDLVLLGAVLQLASGIGLYGMAMADGDPNHMKLGIKTLIAVVVFVAALVGYLQQRKAQIAAEDAPAGASITLPRVKPMFHVAGGLAFINILVATLWT